MEDGKQKVGQKLEGLSCGVGVEVNGRVNGRVSGEHGAMTEAKALTDLGEGLDPLVTLGLTHLVGRIRV